MLTVAAAVGRPARLRPADAHARALHVPLARVPRAARRSSRPLRLAYAALSGLFVLNLWYPYAFFNSQWQRPGLPLQPWFDWIFGGFATDTWQKKVWSLAVTAIVLAMAWFGLRWAERFSRRTPRRAETRRRPRMPPWLARPAPGEHPRTTSTSAAWRAGRRSRSSPWPASSASSSCAARPEGRAEPQRQRLPSPDGALGGRPDRRGPRAARRLVSRTCRSARRFFHHYQSLPHTLTAYAARVTGAGDQTHLPLDPVPAARAVADLRLLGGAPARMGPVDGGGRGRRLAAGRQRIRLRLRARQLHLAGLRRVLAALGDVAASDRLGAHLARGVARDVLRGRSCWRSRSRSRATSSPATWRVLTVGVWVLVARAPASCAGSAARRVVVARLVARSPRGCSCRCSATRSGRRRASSTRARSSTTPTARGRSSAGSSRAGSSTTGASRSSRCSSSSASSSASLEARRDLRARALLGAFALSLLLFFGRPTLGPVLDLLPGFHDVQIHRFVMGVHLAGILLAGVGLGWLLRTASQLCGRAALPRSHRRALAVGRAARSWWRRDRARACLDRACRLRPARSDADPMPSRQPTRPTAATSTGSSRSSRRAATGVSTRGCASNWGADYNVGYVPVYAWLADRDVDAIGFTFRTIASLSNDIEARFDETNPAQLRDVQRPVRDPPARPEAARACDARRAQRRSHRLWRGARRAATSRSSTVPRRSRRTERTSMRPSRRVHALGPGLAGRSTRAWRSPAGGASRTDVRGRDAACRGGRDRARQQAASARRTASSPRPWTASRPAVVLLKASYDPRWTVTVDGLPDKPDDDGAEPRRRRGACRQARGQFRYEPYGHYPAADRDRTC